jgi:hypothetical protein
MRCYIRLSALWPPSKPSLTGKPLVDESQTDARAAQAERSQISVRVTVSPSALVVASWMMRRSSSNAHLTRDDLAHVTRR